jgi:acetylserotonin O-methyltransferase
MLASMSHRLPAVPIVSPSRDDDTLPVVSSPPAADLDARHVLDLLYGFRRSKTLFTAVGLGLFDGRRPPGAGVDRLLTACDALGLLRKCPAGYENTPVADRFLRSDSPDTLVGYIRYSDAALYALWGDLQGAVVDGTNRWTAVFGDEHGACKRAETFSSRDFAIGMHGLGLLSSPAIVEHFDLSSFRFLLDLGGSTGHFAIAAKRRYPAMRVAVVDKSEVLDVARQYVSADIELVAADFCCDELPTGDLFVLGRILHHRDHQAGIELLRRLYDRLPTSGGVLVVEALLDNPDKALALDTQLHSLNMLACSNGTERTGVEYTAWLREVGFRDVRVGFTGTPLDVIVGLK